MDDTNKGPRVQTSLVTIGCLLVVTLLPLAYLLADWSLKNPAAPQHLMERLHQGMSKEQVRALLGNPKRETTDNAGRETWIYGHDWKWYFLTVRFSPKNELIEFVHDD